MAFKFWSILFSFVVGLLGVGQLHDYLVTGTASPEIEDAPRVFRAIIDSHDKTNARRLVEAAAYADAAGQYAVIPGNVKRTIERLTGRIERDRFDESPVHVSVPGMTDAECVRVARFLTFRDEHLVLRDEPEPVATAEVSSAKTYAAPKPRVAVGRPLLTKTGFAGI